MITPSVRAHSSSLHLLQKLKPCLITSNEQLLNQSFQVDQSSLDSLSQVIQLLRDGHLAGNATNLPYQSE